MAPAPSWLAYFGGRRASMARRVRGRSPAGGGKVLMPAWTEPDGRAGSRWSPAAARAAPFQRDGGGANGRPATQPFRAGWRGARRLDKEPKHRVSWNELLTEPIRRRTHLLYNGRLLRHHEIGGAMPIRAKWVTTHFFSMPRCIGALMTNPPAGSPPGLGSIFRVTRRRDRQGQDHAQGRRHRHSWTDGGSWRRDVLNAVDPQGARVRSRRAGEAQLTISERDAEAAPYRNQWLPNQRSRLRTPRRWSR
jgi:hypothetical protein